MRHFEKIATGIDVAPLRAQILAQPELWDAYAERRASPESPHHGVPDIWVRFRARSELTEPQHYREPHFSVFYPAWRALPALQPIVFGLMAQARAVQLGGILITKIPPGGRVKPHSDAAGGWHPNFYNHKVYVPVMANDRCVNYCEDEAIVLRPGDASTFNNLLMHEVVNDGPTDRVTAIVCMRIE